MASEAIVQRALELYDEELSRLPNVVGVGIVDDPHGDGAALAVYVKRKVPEEALEPQQRIPNFVSVRWNQEEYRVPVSIREGGTPRLE